MRGMIFVHQLLLTRTGRFNQHYGLSCSYLRQGYVKRNNNVWAGSGLTARSVRPSLACMQLILNIKIALGKISAVG
jgi:hypothetical protein